MAQINDYNGSDTPEIIKKDIRENMRKECVFCKKVKPFRIFWDCGPNDCFYVCEDCESIVRGLYIDIVLETAEQEKKSVDSVIDEFRNKVHGIIEMRREHRN